MLIFKRFNIPLYLALIGIAVLFMATQNIVFWQSFWHKMSFDTLRNTLFASSVVITLTCGLVILFALTLWGRLRLPFIAVFLLLSTLFNYYSARYHIYMDRDMLINIFETNSIEVLDLISYQLIFWLILGVLAPLFFLSRLSIYKISLWKSLLQRALLILGSLAIVSVIALGFYKDYASFFRNNQQILKLTMPVSYLASSLSYVKKQYADNLPFQTIGDDAHFNRPQTPQGTQKKTLFIMVVGETARSQNFSLNGYHKATNPLLSQQANLVSFQDVTACGTATAVSVPCMFSQLTHDSFDKAHAQNQENALDVLQKADYTLLWRENDHGCKGVCDRIPTEEVADFIDKNSASTASASSTGLYHDEALLFGLPEYINAHQNTENLVIVLHMNGSHGPTYYQRYPDHFKHFQPSCDTKNIETCERILLENVYDNTILYTDYVLNATIELLKQYDDEYETAMLYISDHGESLGENGFYLHGAPYMIAPKEQTTVPLIFWGSDAFYQDHALDQDCLTRNAQTKSYSHDHIFHSLFGLLYVETQSYDAHLDLFSECHIR